jgi:hypothetical protein
VEGGDEQATITVTAAPMAHDLKHLMDT